LHQQYAAAHPEMMDAKPESPDQVRPLKDVIVSDIRSELWMLLGAVALVLLIACGNVGGLLLARASSRFREFAIRTAVGAGRGRLVGQLLVESVFTACLGGALGVALAQLAVKMIRSTRFVDLPRAGEVRMDGPVLAFTVLLSLATGALFGLVPSLIASNPTSLPFSKGAERPELPAEDGNGFALAPTMCW
jgi:putative ABC transport system permease protein